MHFRDYIKKVFAEADDHADSKGATILNFAEAQEHARKEAQKIILGNDWSDKPYTLSNSI